MTAQRFHNWLCDARDWAVSRNRYWSVPPARHTAQGCAPPAHWERGLASSGAARRPPAAFHREARLPPAFGGPRLHTQPWVGAGGVGAGARGGGDPSWTFPRACAVQPRHERSGHTTHHAVPPVPALPKVSDPRDVGSQKYRSATRYLLWGGGGGETGSGLLCIRWRHTRRVASRPCPPPANRGTPLPIWTSEDGEEVVVIGSVQELEELSGQKARVQ